MVGMDLEYPETRSWLLSTPVSGRGIRQGLPREEPDVRRSGDPGGMEAGSVTVGSVRYKAGGRE
ncbi:unnamed protein product [Staurois parvus]|uniref:Uncharacterized protein n=1 Tax=Staurois parvus TaxID=386267 RepID=A0ABN9HDI8_9NEOB|nr:unnamed protein product [Staurois parvus]